MRRFGPHFREPDPSQETRRRILSAIGDGRLSGFEVALALAAADAASAGVPAGSTASAATPATADAASAGAPAGSTASAATPATADAGSAGVPAASSESAPGAALAAASAASSESPGTPATADAGSAGASPGSTASPATPATADAEAFLYPTLHRLEADGQLEAAWSPAGPERRRRTYARARRFRPFLFGTR